jgi:hypothetical protein
MQTNNRRRFIQLTIGGLAGSALFIQLTIGGLAEKTGKKKRGRAFSVMAIK